MHDNIPRTGDWIETIFPVPILVTQIICQGFKQRVEGEDYKNF